MFSFKKRVIFSVLVLLCLGSAGILLRGFYLSNTEIAAAHGGILREGIVGKPRFLNPIYARVNDADRDISQLIFSGLYKRGQDGKLLPDLATEEPIVEENGRAYTINLRENVEWHNGQPFSADDIVFTIHTIQDGSYNSPIRAEWIGVTIEKLTEHQIKFHLADPYAPFPEQLTLGMLPSHIWKDIPAESFPLSSHNLQDAVGSGMYKLSSILKNDSGKVQEIQLRANKDYYGEIPLIETVYFRFFDTQDDVIKEANRGGLDTFAVPSLGAIKDLRNSNFETQNFSLPRYFALFFNFEAQGEQSVVSKLRVRQALQLALDRQALVDTLFGEHAYVASSPLLPHLFEITPVSAVQTSDQQKALELLKQEGFVAQNGKIGNVPSAPPGIQQDLTQGAQGEQVRLLQHCLAQDKEIYPEEAVTGAFDQNTLRAVIAFQNKYAKDTLAPIGLTAGTGKVGPLTRQKLNALCFSVIEIQPLRITITTLDQTPLLDTAQELKRQWEQFGIEVIVDAQPSVALEREIIKQRKYQTLLFGELLGLIPDPFPYWHSSQTVDPGLNLSLYENRKLDTLLEKARKEADPATRKELYEQIQTILTEDIPAIVLYQFDYQYMTSKNIGGIEEHLLSNPAERFGGMEKWYLNVRRTWK